MRFPRRLQSGFTLVETAIATAILAYVTVNFVGSFVNLAHSQVRSRLMLQAADYARESLEVVYNLNANTYNNPGSWDTEIYDKVNNTFHPHFDPISKEVSLVSGSDPLNSFYQRSITFHEVCRDPGDGEPTSPPCPLLEIDPNVVKVVSTVTVNHAGTSTDVEISSFVINPGSI